MKIDNVEIMAVGTWNGIPFTVRDLDAIAQSFRELSLAGKLPVKLGHDARDTEPAQGWITAVRREGDKLLATIDQVPSALVDEIKQGRWRHVSVELLRNVAKGDKKYPLVLDGLAILGAARPAVDVLQGLHELVARALPGWRFGSRVSFNRKLEGSDVNEVERLQAEMINLKFNQAIELGRIEANQRESFFKRYGRAPVAEQAAEVDNWIASAPKATTKLNRMQTYATPQTEVTDETPDDQIIQLTRQKQDEHWEKYREKLGYHEASLLVFRDPQNKEAVLAYLDREHLK